MNQVKDKNPFSLPPKAQQSADDRLLSPKLFKRWVEALPTGSPLETARELYQKLNQLNRTQLAAQDRLKDIELLQPTLGFVLDSLVKNYARMPLPLPKREQSISALSTALYILVVQGYKLVLDQIDKESIAKRLLNRSLRGKALANMLYYLGRTLLHNSQLYRGRTRYLWGEIHWAYCYAVKHKIVNFAFEIGQGDRQTAGDLYKQALLLATSGSHRMLAGDVVRVYQALFIWAKQCELIPLSKAQEGDGPFLVDTSKDEPPIYRHKDSDVVEGWVLKTEKLNHTLVDILDSKSVGVVQLNVNKSTNTPEHISSDLIARLMVNWGIGFQRGDERRHAIDDANVVAGLELLYELYGGEPIKEGVEESVKLNFIQRNLPDEIDQELTLPPDQHIVEGDDLHNFKAKSEGSSVNNVIRIDEQFSHQNLHCKVIDRSENGCRLVWSGKEHFNARVGELVGVSFDDNNDRVSARSLGAIRWLNGRSSGRLMLGVELFNGSVAPVVVHRSRGGGVQEIWCGLIQKSDQEGGHLLVPPFYPKPDDQLVLLLDERERPVELVLELDSTASFSLFQFRFKGEGKVVSIEERDEKSEAELSPEEEFASLWDNI
ncbi:MAG: hypothetical protein GY696_22745 [Gammaproteobacteria bacterium]|nr:hypothetical protein [Gammaproteobacteria bacterium]